MRRGGIIVHDGIGPIVGYMAASTALNVAEGMQSGAERVEAHAKSNAPWSDITGRARNGLSARIYIEGGEVVLELSHSVDYGQWLELIQEGRFAIIMPTLEALGPEILKDAGGKVTDTRGAGVS